MVFFFQCATAGSTPTFRYILISSLCLVEKGGGIALGLGRRMVYDVFLCKGMLPGIQGKEARHLVRGFHMHACSGNLCMSTSSLVPDTQTWTEVRLRALPEIG